MVPGEQATERRHGPRRARADTRSETCTRVAPSTFAEARRPPPRTMHVCAPLTGTLKVTDLPGRVTGEEACARAPCGSRTAASTVTNAQAAMRRQESIRPLIGAASADLTARGRISQPLYGAASADA